MNGRTLHIRWSVSAAALRRSAGAASMGIDAASMGMFSTVDATIDLSIELAHDLDGGCNHGQTARVQAVLVAPRGSGADLATEFAGGLTGAAFGEWEVDDGEHLLHVTLGEPSSDTPLLVATLRVNDAGEPSVLYARTTLLAHLGLPGGRYEVAGATLLEGAACGVGR